MQATRQHDAADRMIDPAKRLHRLGGEPDLVADRFALPAAEQRDIAVLDVVGIRDRRALRQKGLERYASLVLSKQCFGHAPCSNIVHRGISFLPQIIARHPSRSTVGVCGVLAPSVNNCVGVAAGGQRTSNPISWLPYSRSEK